MNTELANISTASGRVQLGASVLFRDRQSYTHRWGILVGVDGDTALCRDPETGRAFLADVDTLAEVPGPLPPMPKTNLPAESRPRQERLTFSVGSLIITGMLFATLVTFGAIIAVRHFAGDAAGDVAVEIGRAFLWLPAVLFSVWAERTDRVRF